MDADRRVVCSEPAPSLTVLLIMYKRSIYEIGVQHSLFHSTMLLRFSSCSPLTIPSFLRPFPIPSLRVDHQISFRFREGTSHVLDFEDMSTTPSFTDIGIGEDEKV